MGLRIPTATSTRSRRAALTAVLCVAALVLSACASGFGAQTNQIYTAAEGTNERGDIVDVLNALFVANADDTATLSAGLLVSEPDGDTLQDVAVTTLTGDDIDAQLVRPVDLTDGELHSTGQDAEVIIRGTNFGAGDFVHLSLSFSKAGTVELDAPVVARTAVYDGVAPAPNSAGGPAPSAGASPSAKPSG